MENENIIQENKEREEVTKLGLPVDKKPEPISSQNHPYFKNSKVVDKNGKILNVYHGTKNPGFKEFNPTKSKSQFGNYKFGNANVNYFTASKDAAAGYTSTGREKDGNVYEVNLNIEKPYEIDAGGNWKNIKNKELKQVQNDVFNDLANKFKNKNISVNDLPEINEHLAVLGYGIKPNDENNNYFDLVRLENNTMFGKQHPIMYQYNLNDFFNDEDYFSELRNNVANNDENIGLQTDDIVRLILYLNKYKGKDYDGIILKNINDVGPTGNAFSGNTTDYITIKDANQIKSSSNKNPTLSKNIYE